MDTTKLDVLRDRYMQDELSVRLGGLATNLMRVASVADHPQNWQAVKRLLEESKFLIEWTVPDAPLDKQTALVELQIRLALWSHRWHIDRSNSVKRSDLVHQARTWAEQVLEMSGLLNQTRENTT